MAAGRLRRPDGKEVACPRGCAVAADDRPHAGNARSAPPLRATGRCIAMAARDTDRRQPRAGRVWYLSVCQPPPSANTRTNTANATGVMVLRRRDRAWRRTDAGTDLPRSLPRRV